MTKRSRCNGCNKLTGHGVYLCNSCKKSAALSAEGDALLAIADADEVTRLAEEQQRDLLMPRNDPEYLRALAARDRTRQEIENEMLVLHQTRDSNGKFWHSLAMRDQKNRAKANEMSRKIQELLCVKLINHDDTN